MNIASENVDFWFVWTKKGRVPSRCHSTRESAESEAKRLASLNPQRKFIILQAKEKFHASCD